MEWLNKINYEAMIWFIYVYVLIKNNNPVYFYILQIYARRNVYILYGNVK